MKTKALLSMIVLMFVCMLSLRSQTTGNTTTGVMLSGYTARSFTAETIDDNALNLILQCGNKAPSARNGQPWRFTVVKDQQIIGQLVRNATAGNIVIIISGLESGQQGMSVEFDCGLATENMVVAAQSLGLGAHIYTGPVQNINTTLKQTLEIPAGYKAIAVLQIGQIDAKTDAVSSASPRNDLKGVVNYK
jgi:nitroreductase